MGLGDISIDEERADLQGHADLRMAHRLEHLDYGSRIPPEIGMVQDNSTAGHIAAYGKAALASDPRVQSVISAIAQLMVNQSIQFSGTVQPIGTGSVPTSVNQVIVSPVGGA